MSYMDLPALVSASTDPRVPADERFDINRDLLKMYISGMTDHTAEFAEFREELTLGKSLFEQTVAGLEPRMRTVPVRDKSGRLSALHVQELGILSPYPGTRWIEKPDAMGFEACKALVDHGLIDNLIINTRVRQCQLFQRPYVERSEYPYGSQIIRRDGERLTADDRKDVERIQAFIDNSGDVEDAAQRSWVKRRDDVRTHVGKLIRNTLTYDAMPIEVERTAGGGISGYYAIPAETVRLCSEAGYEGDDAVVGLQLFQLRVITLYEAQQLVYPVRNPRSELTVGGYGFPEPEMQVRMTTALLNAFTYTAAGLDRNQLPRGILQMFGNYKSDELDYFKRQWNALLSGPAQRWRLPVLVSNNKESGATYTPVDTQFNEMHFVKWVSFNTSMKCACYGMAPEEINLDSFTSRNGGISTAGQDTAERLASSKDKGLEPLLQALENIDNQWIIPRLGYGKKYIRVYRGLHPVAPELQWQQRVAIETRDEIRADMGMPPCEDPEIGEAPLDPTGAAIYQQGLMMRSMDQGGGGGMPGMGGPPGQNGQNGQNGPPGQKPGQPGGQQQPQLPDAIRQRLAGQQQQADGRGAANLSRAGSAVKGTRVLVLEPPFDELPP